jgi:hypothetical protein
MKQTFIAKIIILTTISLNILFAGNLSPSEITNMVAKIKEERVGISLVKLETTENPFPLYLPKKKDLKEDEVVEKEQFITPLEAVYTLKAIMNKAAFIDNKWYRKGDSIGNYKVGKVSSSSLILESENDNKILSLEKKKKSFIKLNKGYR